MLPGTKATPVSLFLCLHDSLALPYPVRSQDPGQRRVLDRAARQRRINRQLEALENDNFQDDPHAGLPQLGKRLPQFDDDADTGEPGRRRRWVEEGEAQAGEARPKEGGGVCLEKYCRGTSGWGRGWGVDDTGAPLALPGTGFCDCEPAAVPLCVTFN